VRVRRIALTTCLLVAATSAGARDAFAEPVRSAASGATRGSKIVEPPASDPVATSLAHFEASIQRITLPNGLRVVLNRDPTSATVAVSVTYGVGSINEVTGQSGFAHLFEHMMFQGSKHAAKGAHFKLITERGGTLNGTTDSDRTNYFEELPQNELALALWLESDRMRWLSVTPENFENQRAVVEEEYRMRVQNQPYALGTMRLSELVFQGYPPYAHPTIGSMADLDAAKFEWVKAFHDRYYAPNNAVLTIAGNFEPERALALVNEYFGPAQPTPTEPPPPPSPPTEPSHGSARVTDDNAHTPAVLFGYEIPPSRAPDHYALDLASVILAGGETSRLYRTLVHDEASAEEVSAWTDGHRGPDQLSVMAVLTEKGRLGDVEAKLEAAIERLRSTPPSRAELERAKHRIRTGFLFELQTNLARATQLGEFEALYGDARLLASEPSRYEAVTPEEVRSAAARWLVPGRRSEVEVMPRGKEATP